MYFIITFSEFNWMLITETCDVGPLDKLREFLSFQHCRDGLNLKIGKTYLIMGVAQDIRKDEENQSWVKKEHLLVCNCYDD